MEKNEKTSFDVFKDLSCRLPYDVVCNVRDDNMSKDYTLDGLDFGGCTFKETEGFYRWYSFEIRPYLRPMSSMTEEETNEYNECFEEDRDDIMPIGKEFEEFYKNKKFSIYSYPFVPMYRHIIWLLKNHFDFIGLIPKGLALEAPEGMYN